MIWKFLVIVVGSNLLIFVSLHSFFNSVQKVAKNVQLMSFLDESFIKMCSTKDKSIMFLPQKAKAWFFLAANICYGDRT